MIDNLDSWYGWLGNHGVETTQFAKGTADTRTVATITFSGVTDANECRAEAQATIQTVTSRPK